MMMMMMSVFQVSLCERSRTQLETLVEKLKAALAGLLLLLVLVLLNTNLSELIKSVNSRV